MSNIVKVNGNELEVAQEVLNKLDRLNKVKKELERYEKQFKVELKNAMEQNGIKSINNDVFTASYIEENTRTVFDTDKAKKLIEDCGMFVSDFEKETKVKSSLRIKYK